LQSWVDQKLGGIVDELVKAEIAKALEEAGVFWTASVYRRLQPIDRYSSPSASATRA
jgi:hypothetical protein